MGNLAADDFLWIVLRAILPGLGAAASSLRVPRSNGVRSAGKAVTCSLGLSKSELLCLQRATTLTLLQVVCNTNTVEAQPGHA